MQSFRRALAPAALAAALAFACALHSSLACPIVQPPQPLRTLYKGSARVVVARVGASEVVEAGDSMVFVRVALHVTENVKGEGDRVARLYYWGDKEESPEAVRPVSSSGRPAPTLKRGERFLFFLDRHEDRADGYALNDAGYGIKQLSDEALKVYLERLKELADITRREPEDKAALAEWLVRCAEEPATRWEGAYELLESAVAAESEDGEGEGGEASTDAEVEAESAAAAGAEVETAKEQKASAAVTETQTPPPPNPDEMPKLRLPDFRRTPADASFITLLNPVQKQRLAGALFGAEELGEGETALMQVVQEFGDPRFAPFVLAHLHRVEDEPPQAAEAWLTSLAAALGNEEIVGLAEEYVTEAPYYYDEEDEEQKQAEAAAGQSGAESSEGSKAEEAVAAPETEAPEAPEDPEAEAAALAASAERATRKRAALLKAALSQIDYFVSTGRLASN